MQYKITTTTYNEPGIVPTEDCNAIIFTNNSDGAITINKQSVAAGESLINNGFPNEVDKSEYHLEFATGESNPSVTVRRKIYV